jgi:hydroxyethylthiazole kinase
MQHRLWEHLSAIRTASPLVHNITNYVVMNNTANALLAIGASPIMSHAVEEAEDMIAICESLVINIGTLSPAWIKSMYLAAARALALGKPWVLDPVGAGATPFRDTTLQHLLTQRPSVVRGNASEILALARHNTAPTKGVDSTAQSDEALAAARALQTATGAVICISGATDIILAGDRIIRLSNGHELMPRVTGLGCTASAMIAAYCAVIPDHAEATAAAMAQLGICGEIAAETSAGPGSLQVALLDKLHNLSEAEFTSRLKLRTDA